MKKKFLPKTKNKSVHKPLALSTLSGGAPGPLQMNEHFSRDEIQSPQFCHLPE
jgi:hypothetical protein